VALVQVVFDFGFGWYTGACFALIVHNAMKPAANITVHETKSNIANHDEINDNSIRAASATKNSSVTPEHIRQIIVLL